MEPIDIPPDAPERRRAVVLFLPPEIEQLVDEIRHRWDPLMAARIDAHLTLIHDVQDHGALGDTLVRAAATTPPFELTLTTTGCWGPAKWGIYLAVDDHDGGVWALHEALAPIEDPRWLRGTFRPHVTLLHGRTVTEDAADAAWAELEHFVADQRVRIDEVCVVESHPGRWEVFDRFVLGTDVSLPSRHG